MEERNKNKNPNREPSVITSTPLQEAIVQERHDFFKTPRLGQLIQSVAVWRQMWVLLIEIQREQGNLQAHTVGIIVGKTSTRTVC